MLVGGGSDTKQTANRFGLPEELIKEADGFQETDGIYPDNMQAVELFDDMATQWRVGMSGATGLDYSALPAVMSIRGIEGAERQDVFDCLKIMERAALGAMKKR